MIPLTGVANSSFPRSRRAVRTKVCGGKRAEGGPTLPSWLGLARPSTPWALENEDVDARVKPAQDEFSLFGAVLVRGLPKSRFSVRQACALAGRQAPIDLVLAQVQATGKLCG